MLRDYQADCVKACFSTIKQGRPALCVLATGGGKGRIFSTVSKYANERNRNILLIVNKLVLIDNAVKELRYLGIEASKFSGKVKDITNITVGTIQSLYKEKHLPFDVIIWDEVHNFDFESDKLRTFISRFKDPIHIGFTATAFRNGEYIYGEGKFWKLSYQKDIKSLTNEGYLVPICYQGQNKDSKISLEGVKKDKEDYIESSLIKRVLENKEKIPLQVKDALEKSKERKKIIVITTCIEHAEIVLSYLDDTATIIHSNLPDKIRENNLDSFMNGEKRIMVSVLIASEGLDCPAADCLWLMRPTRSSRLYIQAIGRILRTFKDKKDALLLDYGQCVETLGDVYNVDIGNKDKKKKKPTLYCCLICDKIYTVPRNKCECGYLFLTNCIYCGKEKPLMSKCECGETVSSRLKKTTKESFNGDSSKETFLIKAIADIYTKKETAAQYLRIKLFHKSKFGWIEGIPFMYHFVFNTEKFCRANGIDHSLEAVNKLLDKIRHIKYKKDGKWFKLEEISFYQNMTTKDSFFNGVL